MHIHRPSRDTWPQVPFGEWRLWDTQGTTWYALQPRRGVWNFAQLDQDVSLAESHQVGLLLTLGQSPPWASLRPTEPPAWRPGGAAPPADRNDWITYIRTLATRYRGRIQAYEVWNEPNLAEFFTGSREQLASLAKDAYQTIHQADPAALVLSPAITGAYDIGWFRHYLDLRGADSADVIAYHIYTSPAGPEAAVPTILQLRSILRERGINKQLWNTETGYSIESRFSHPEPLKGSMSRILTQQEAVAYVMRTYLLNWAAGTDRVYWYDWDGERMGLGDNLGREKKPGADAYATIQRWMTGATLLSCDQDRTQNWGCALSRNGHSEWIVWSSDRPQPIAISPEWKFKQTETLSPTGELINQPRGNRPEILSTPIPTRLY